MQTERFRVSFRNQPERYVVFVADFESAKLQVSRQIGQKIVTDQLPLSPEQWTRRDRSAWNTVRRVLPDNFNLVQRLRDAILSPV